MPLLLKSDYGELTERGISYVEDEAGRFLIFPAMPLPDGLYNVGACEVLVQIPVNYNQAGNDMLWTYPRLARIDGKPIPATSGPGEDSRQRGDKVYCRWSRHWHPGQPGEWRAGRDDVISIYRRVEWALQNPDPT